MLRDSMDTAVQAAHTIDGGVRPSSSYSGAEASDASHRDVDIERPRQDSATTFPPSIFRSEIDDASLSSRRNSIVAIEPPDQGYAWVFLAAAFVIELLVWGFPFSVGIFHEYWTSELFPDASDRATLALAATLQTGLMYLLTSLGTFLFAAYPEKINLIQYSGLVLSVTGTIGSAFVTKSWHLVLTCGVLYAVGGALAYTPAVILIFEWFAAKRGLAAGIMFAGTGIGGTVVPFIIAPLLDHFSYKAAVISLGIGYGLFGAVALYFVRPRVPVARNLRQAAGLPRHSRKIDLVFLKRNTFWAFICATLFLSLGTFIPTIYLPSYAADLGLSKTMGTLLVSMMNASSVLGLVVLGYLSDKLPARLVLSISTFGSAIAIFLFWGIGGEHLAVLIVFSLAFGFCALGYSALWTKMISIIAKEDPNLPGVLFSIFGFAKGIGSIASGPLANALLASGELANGKFAYGFRNYGNLLIYTGTVVTVGSLSSIMYRDR